VPIAGPEAQESSNKTSRDTQEFAPAPITFLLHAALSWRTVGEP